MRRLLFLFVAVALAATTIAVVAPPVDAAFPGGIGKIAFVSDRDHPSEEIYVRDFGGSAATRITTNAARDLGPRWSPDGTKLAFYSRRGGTWEVFTINADGTGETRLTSDPYDNHDPAWTPDGKEIVFSSNSSGSRNIHIMDADGTNVRSLTFTADEDVEPAVSPDGLRVLFRRTAGGNADLYTVDMAGQDLQRLTTAAAFDGHGSWSPDGTQIAFTSERDGDAEVFVMGADGANPAQLTANSATDARPNWAPDGSRIAFESNRDGDYDIWMMEPGGANPAYLAASPANELMVDWQPTNRPPVAVDDTATVTAGSATTIDVWVNDTDADGDPLTATIVSFPTKGALVPLGPASYGYTPTAPGPATDSFTYTVADGRGGISNVATVRITITPAFAVHWVGMVDPATGAWHLRPPTTGAVTSFLFGNPGDVPFMGDWDCDGVETPGLYRRSDGFVYLRNANTTGTADVEFFFGNPGDLPLAGDFDGDGCDTVSIHRPTEQRFFIINKLGSKATGLGAAEVDYLFGDPGDKPFVGDFDGDGTETVGLHRESTGLVYFRNRHTQGIADAQFIFGDPGDRFVAGDWNADGHYSPAMFRPSNVTCYQRFTNSQGVADAEFVFGEPSWLPVAGVVAP